MPIPLSDRVAYRRAERLLTQRQLAAAAGVSVATITRIEGGGYVPHGPTLQKIAAALGVSIRDLIEPAELLEGRRRKKAPPSAR
jgi:XRE family transcriptional regulator, regulator of sulfur utilization